MSNKKYVTEDEIGVADTEIYTKSANASTRKTVMLPNSKGKLVPRQFATAHVNQNEDFDHDAHAAMSRTAPTIDKKFRLKDKKSGATRGVFGSHSDAMAAHAKHPQKSSLMVEDFTDKYQKQERSIMITFKEFKEIHESVVASLDETQHKVGDTVTPKIGPHAGVEHTVIHVTENVYKIAPNLPASKIKYRLGVALANHADLDTRIAEDRSQLIEKDVYSVSHMGSPDGEKLFPKGKKVFNHTTYYPDSAKKAHDNLVKLGYHDVQTTKNGVVQKNKSNDVDESVFDWKKNKAEIDWKDDETKPAKSADGGTLHKAREKERNAEGGAVVKKSVGRPAGVYNQDYKIDKTKRETKEYKDALSAKVRASKAEGFEARTEFKKGMDAAIKKRQADIHNSK
jgi:hypothetical protein